MKNTMSIEEFEKELVSAGYTKENARIETKQTFTHYKKEYNCKKSLAIRLAWDWCQGFDLKDGSIWAIAKVKTVPTKFLKSLEETKIYCEEFSKTHNFDSNYHKHFLKEMTEAYFTKEKPYWLFVYGCDDSSYSQSFATMKEIDKLIAGWGKNPPDSSWDGSFFTN